MAIYYHCLDFVTVVDDDVVNGVREKEWLENSQKTQRRNEAGQLVAPQFPTGTCSYKCKKMTAKERGVGRYQHGLGEAEVFRVSGATQDQINSVRRADGFNRDTH